jgi:hypothetical protein
MDNAAPCGSADPELPQAPPTTFPSAPSKSEDASKSRFAAITPYGELNHPALQAASVELRETVARIIDDVARRGDAAVRDHSVRFDKLDREITA